VQPQIEPLFPSNNEIALLSIILGEKETDPYAQVRETVRGRVGATGAFEKVWRRTLHDGLLPANAMADGGVRVNEGAVAAALADAAGSMGASDELEVLFLPSPHMHDGRWANNGWLQEMPHPVTKVSWDNPALISPATAHKLGISTNRHPITPQYNHGQIATIGVAGQSMDIAMWPQPGLADGVVVLHLGYGRTNAGRVGDGTGFNTYSVRSTGAMRFARGASAAPKAGASPYLLACTQDHWVMEGRDILREVDLGAWQKFGDIDFSNDPAIQIDPYGNDRGLNFAGRLGMESHTPANKDIYLDWQKQAPGLRFTEVDENGKPLRDSRGNIIGRKNANGRPIQQWGMSIDLTKCSGCSACTVACQAENNIPIVGKMEVAKGREMHWIRVDRYYASEAIGLPGVGGDFQIPAQPEMYVQPLPCVHCESAPCEVVCPVNATVHDPEGMNDMAYNRCIGTRYCSNNCPYKVRRFNYFDYATKQFRGTYAGEEFAESLPEIMRPPSEYFVPPRLRQKKLEVATMQYNPHVTVRSRGVMEKCTFCVQRVNAARVEAKVAGFERIPDGFVQVACQQACPTGAIVFGDIYDNDANDGAGSVAKQKRNDPRTYALLAYLNTRPRTTFMVRLRNPNPKIRTPNEEPFHHGGGGGHEHGDGHETKQGGHAMGRILSLPVLSGNGAMA
jgi:molybdopterin-containing oxidoreductase family iron-sulfur binding subunit